MGCRVLQAVIILGVAAYAFAAAPAGVPAAAPASAVQDEIVGDWAGALDLGTAKMPVIFHITKADDGTLAATLDSPDQGAFGIAVDATTFEDDKLTMTIAAIGGGYSGTLADDGTIAGTWAQGGQSMPLNLTRKE